MSRKNAPQILVAAREAERASRLAAMRDGRKIRSVTFTDRKKDANRKACRGRVSY